MTLIGTFDELMTDIRSQEPHRHDCEVRAVAAFETDSQRAVYLEGEKGVRDRRGDVAADRLRRDVWSAMKAQRKQVEPLQDALFA